MSQLSHKRVKSLLRRFHINPIMVKELRSRMRGWRAFAVLTGVLLLLGGASYALYQVVLSTSRYSSTPLSPQVGQVLFVGLASLELLMVCFITPAVTAGAISGEQEKQTYEMLLATPLRPARILSGKLFSALSYVFLLILAAIPMASLVFIFGGVALKEMLKALVFCLCTAIMLGVVGVFMSAWTGRTTRATVLSYLFVLALLVGPLVAYVMVAVIRQSEPPRWILVLNPVSGMASALAPSSPGEGTMGFLGQLGQVLTGGFSSMLSATRPTKIPRPLYHYTLSIYGGLTLVLYLLSTRLVRPTRRWRIRWREILLAAGALLAFAGLAVGAFLLTAERYEWALQVVATPMPVIVGPEMLAQTQVDMVVVPEKLSMSNSDLAEADQAAIYAAVIRQLATVDHTFEQPPDLAALYVLRTTDDSVGDPNVPQSDSIELPSGMLDKIVDEFVSSTDGPKIVWVGDRGEVPMDDADRVVDGALVTLGNTHVQENGSVFVSGSIYFGSLAAGGRTYVLQRVDGVWQVVGQTEVTWMS